LTKTALITGISGQDGAFLARLLLKKNYQVIGIIDRSRESSTSRLCFLSIDEKIIFKKINLLNQNEIEDILTENDVQEFYNLAALSSVGKSFKNPADTFQFNSLSVLNILEAIRKVSPKTRFYQASSSEMFGNIGVTKLPVKESFLFHPASPYGISKASAHWLTVNYREAYNLQTCCGILFNHESALRPKHFVIKKIIRTALQIKAGEETALILGNISIIRDWGYAPLYVDAMWRMMQQERLDDYLICSADPISLLDFAKIVFARLDLDLGKYIQIDNSLLRALDLQIIYGDNSKAKNELGWNYSLTVRELVTFLLNDEQELLNWEMQTGLRL
jgi:GDPmannose 4,6-dehydratase